MTTPAFLDVHILHAVPFSNLNRDNLGTPKQMVYGGATRARISSQCTKRATRLWLERNTDLGEALRTRRLPQMLRGLLVERYGFGDSEAVDAVKVIFRDVAKTSKNKHGIQLETVGEGTEGEAIQSKELIFGTTVLADDLAALAQVHREGIRDGALGKEGRQRFQDALCGRNPVIALCGRMLATIPNAHIDGALQVAHAFTTHTSTLELDYFTAVDDRVQADDDETGAGHINVGEYTSGVFYRHATVGLLQLADLLDESAAATAEVVSSFVKAFVLAEPTGKQNSANAHTRPDLVAVTLRSDRPVSFASAFEQPMERGRGGGYVAASIEALQKRAAAENRMYGTDGLVGSWYLTSADEAASEGLGEPVDGLADLTRFVEQATASVVGSGSSA